MWNGKCVHIEHQYNIQYILGSFVPPVVTVHLGKQVIVINVIKAAALKMKSLLVIISTGIITSRKNLLTKASHLYIKITLTSGLYSGCAVHTQCMHLSTVPLFMHSGYRTMFQLSFSFLFTCLRGI